MREGRRANFPGEKGEHKESRVGEFVQEVLNILFETIGIQASDIALFVEALKRRLRG